MINLSSLSNVNGRFRAASLVGFLLLFPGFFCYHTLLSKGYIPDFLAGIWAAVSVGMTPIAVVSYYMLYSKIKSTHLLLLRVVTAFIVYCAGVLIVNYMTLPSNDSIDAIKELSIVISSWTTLFFIGCWFPFRSKSTFRICLFSSIVMAAFVLAFMDYSRLIYDMREAASSDNEISSYQGFARSVSIVMLFLTAYSANFQKAALIALAGTGILFLVGARSELFGFIFAAAVALSVLAKDLPSGGKLSLLCVVFAGSTVLVYFLDPAFLLGSRQLEVLNLSESRSWTARMELTENAIREIQENPTFGNLSAHLEYGQGVSAGYAHNIVSSWVALGFFGFLGYCVLLIISMILSFQGISSARSAEAPHWRFAFMISVYCLILVLTSKPVYWALPALAWGLVQGSQLLDFANGKRERRTRAEDLPDRLSRRAKAGKNQPTVARNSRRHA